jgi:hypothetical protein
MIATAILMLLCLPTLTAYSHSKIRVLRTTSIFLAKPSTIRYPRLHCSTFLASTSAKDVDIMNNRLTDINLTAEEDELFATLISVVAEESLGTTVRVAGLIHEPKSAVNH